MFNKDNVIKVINELKKNPMYFVSEAHLQISFIIRAYELYKNRSSYYPEYAIKSNIGKKKIDEIDLMIIDNKDNSKSLIEFKHKTDNSGSKDIKKHLFVKTGDNVEIEPSKMGAQSLGRYDCWKDIERLEYYKRRNKDIKGAYFVFITNDKHYIEEGGTKTFGNGFSMKQGKHNNIEKKWPGNVIKHHLSSITKKRKNKIYTKSYVGKNSFNYQMFQNNIVNNDYGTYWYLVVDIQ